MILNGFGALPDHVEAFHADAVHDPLHELLPVGVLAHLGVLATGLQIESRRTVSQRLSVAMLSACSGVSLS